MFFKRKPYLPEDQLEVVHRALELAVEIKGLKSDLLLLKTNIALMEEGMAYMVRHAQQCNAVMENHASAIAALTKNAVPDDKFQIH